MKKKEKEIQRKSNLIKKSLANGAGMDKKIISEMSFLDCEPDPQNQANYPNILSNTENTTDDVDIAGTFGPVTKTDPGISKIPSRIKISSSTRDLETGSTNSEVSEKKKKIAPSNPKDKASGRFLTWDQAKLRPDQSTIVYPRSLTETDNGSLLYMKVKPSVPGSGLKYGKGPLADRLKSMGIIVSPMSEDSKNRNDRAPSEAGDIDTTLKAEAREDPGPSLKNAGLDGDGLLDGVVYLDRPGKEDIAVGLSSPNHCPNEQNPSPQKMNDQETSGPSIALSKIE
jgi:hypothetical protein